jgi:hypothetical protein
MSLRHPEPLDGVPLEIEFHQHRGLVSHNPPIVSRLDRYNLRSGKFKRAPIGVLHMDSAPRQEPDVRMHAQVRADDAFHVSGPAESGRIDYPLYPRRAGPDNVEFKTANLAMFGLLHRSKQWVIDIHEISRPEVY